MNDGLQYCIVEEIKKMQVQMGMGVLAGGDE
jgi:hypothetical protein